MALVPLYVGLLLVDELRPERRKLMNVLEIMAVAVGRTATDEPTDTLAALGSSAAPPGRTVVAGPSTYHRPDCRLVQGKPGLDRMSIDSAKRSDLSPCRVADPDPL